MAIKQRPTPKNIDGVTRWVTHRLHDEYHGLGRRRMLGLTYGLLALAVIALTASFAFNV